MNQISFSQAVDGYLLYAHSRRLTDGAVMLRRYVHLTQVERIQRIRSRRLISRPFDRARDKRARRTIGICGAEC